jgi:hypothetical protein
VPAAPQVQPPTPVEVQPPAPIQPAAPIEVHPGQATPQSTPIQPSQPVAPVEPTYAAAPPAPSMPAVTPAQPTDFSPPPAPAPQPAPPSTPPSPPLQPGQRVLEIPPTGLQSGSPFAYMSLTEIRGRTPLLLQLVNLQDDTQLFRSDLWVECHDPLYTVEITVPLPPISPPQAGIYALELLYNNELLGALRIVVEDAAQ